MDYKELSLYIALNKTQQEIDEIGFRGICPSGKNMMGPQPKITGNEIKQNRKVPTMDISEK